MSSSSLHRRSRLRFSSSPVTTALPCVLVLTLLHFSQRVSSSRILSSPSETAAGCGTPHSSTTTTSTSDDPSTTSRLTWSPEEGDGESPSNNNTEARALLRVLSSDPCEDLYRSMKSTEPFTDDDGYSFITVRPSELRACREYALSPRPAGATNLRIGGRFKTSLSAAKSDLDNSIKYLQHYYGLLHLAKNSGVPQLPSQYDVIAALTKLKETKWVSADKLYSAMDQAINRLNDGHTFISINDKRTSYTLPLNLVFVFPTTTTWAVRVAPRALQNVKLIGRSKKEFSFNPELYYNATVTTIEGVPAWDYVRNYARDEIGQYPNLGARVNAAFARWGWYVYTEDRFKLPVRIKRNGDFSVRTLDPGAATLKMVVIREGAKETETIQVPWIVQLPASRVEAYRNAQAFVNNFWTESRVRREAEREQRRKRFGEEWEFIGQGKEFEAGEVPRFRAQPTLSKANKISGTLDYFPVYKLADQKTTVVVVPKFSLYKPTRAAEYYVKEITKAFGTAVSPKSGGSRVIIDLQGNGGGIVEWGYWLQQLLIGSAGFNQGPNLNYLMSDFLRIRADGEFVKALVNKNIRPFKWQSYTKPSEEPYTSQGGFFYPSVRHPYGGVKDGNYSKLVKIKTEKLEKILGKTSWESVVGKTPFLLLSDGTCYSTCSTFSAGMKERFKTKLVTVGGLPYKLLQFHAGGGGFILAGGANGAYKHFKDENVRGAPGELEGIDLFMKFSLGFASPVSPTPIEYTFHPGDSRVFFTPDNILDPSLIWNQAASSFDKA